jgi:uncharacterized protein YneF (UPF0154 family)
MDTVGAELVSFFQALKNGSLLGYFILMVLVLIGLALVIGAFVYKRIVTKRLRAASKATQENLETMAVLRKRAMEVKERDDDLRKRDLEVEERGATGAEKSQRARRGRQSHQLQTDFQKVRSVVPNSSKVESNQKTVR